MKHGEHKFYLKTHRAACEPCKIKSRAELQRYRDAKREDYNRVASLQQKRWRRANPEKVKIKWWKDRYGVTLEMYNNMLVQQENACASCRIPFINLKSDRENYSVIQIDHDHKTGKYRGLLCHNCNKGIGHFKDSPEFL